MQKKKRNLISCFVSFRKKENVFFLPKREKECISFSLFFVFSRKRAKATCFQNSVFLFAPFVFATERKKEKCHTVLIFHFLVGQRTMRSADLPPSLLPPSFLPPFLPPSIPPSLPPSLPPLSFSRKLLFFWTESAPFMYDTR